MNGQQGVDIVALSWCIPEIRESLSRAAQELDRHLGAEAGSTGHLKNARIHLHQAHGALQVADVAGVLVLTQEAESIIERGEREELAIDHEAVLALKRALAAVAEYLEDLQAGSTLPPVVLFSFYRALLILRNAERIDPADLYFPDLSIQPPAAILSRGDASEGDDIGMIAASARREFERGLLGFLRGDDNASAIRTMHAAMVRMQMANPARHARAFFWMSLALLDALKHSALPVDLYTRRLVARVNIQARRTLESQDPVADRLLKDLLFALARAQDTSPVAAEVRRHYHLAGTVPADFERVRYGLSDPTLVRQAREAVTSLKKSWEKIVRGSQKETETFVEAAGDLVDAMRKLPWQGMTELADAMASVPAALKSASASDEALSLEVATAILFAEEALDGGLRGEPAYDTRAGQLGGRLLEVLNRPGSFSEAAPQWLVEISRKASERITLGAFVNELKANLRSCEQALDGYFRDHSTAGQVAAVRPLIDQSMGVLKALGYSEAAKACAALGEDVQDIADDTRPSTARDHQRIANNLSAIGFFVESLLQPTGQGSTYRFDETTREFQAQAGERRINRADERATADVPSVGGEMDVAVEVVGSTEARVVAERSALVPWIALLAAAPQALDVHDNLQRCLVALERDSVLVDDVDLKRRSGDALKLLGKLIEAAQAPGAVGTVDADTVDSLLSVLAQLAGVPAPARAETVVAQAPAVEEQTPADDDQELLEIFLLEADEVLAAIDESLQQSRTAPSDAAPLTTIRRAFHTLKGSSRMVGLMHFGDAGWAFEQVLNKWLAEERPGTPKLYRLIEAGHELFSVWVARLHQDSSVTMDTAALIAQCEALRDGREYVPAAQPAADSVAAAAAVAMPVDLVAAPVTPVEAVEPVEPVEAVDAVEAQAPEAVEEAVPAVAEEAPATVVETSFETVEAPAALADEPLAFAEGSAPMVEQPAVVEPVSFEVEPAAVAAEEVAPEAARQEFSVEDLEAFIADEDAFVVSAESFDAGLPALESGPSVGATHASVDADDGQYEHGGRNGHGLSDEFLAGFELASAAEDNLAEAAPVPVVDPTVEADSVFVPEAAAEAVEQAAEPEAAAPIESTEADVARAAFEAAFAAMDEPEAVAEEPVAADGESDTVAEVPSLLGEEPAMVAEAPAFVTETPAFAAEAPALAVEEAAFVADEPLAVSQDVMPLTADSAVEIEPVDAADAIEAAMAAQSAEAFHVAEAMAAPEQAAEPDPIEAQAVETEAVEPAPEKVWIGNRSIDAQLFEIFNVEAADTRKRLDSGLTSWRERRERAAPESLVRALHSLVGTSRHVGLLQLRAIAEPAEQFLLNHAKATRPLPADHFALLYAAIASINSMLDQFSQRIEPQRDPQSERAMMDLAFQWSNPESMADAVEGDRSDRGEALRKKAAQVLGAAKQAAQVEHDSLHGLVDEIDADLGPIFFEETDDLLPQIDQHLRQWRAHPADESAANGLMRLLHTIKGSARMAGAMRFGQMVHEMETRVEEAIGLPEVPETLVDQLLAQYDQAFSTYELLKAPAESMPATSAAPAAPQLGTAASSVAGAAASAAAGRVAHGAVEQGAAGQPAKAARPVPAAANALHAELDPELLAGAAQAAAAAQQVIRVRADLLDRMVSESGEVSVARARLDAEMGLIRQALGELTENVNRLRGQLREIEIQADNQIQAQIANSKDSHADFDPLEFDRYTRFQELTKMLAESVNDVATVQQNALRSVESATQDLARQGQVSRSLQQNLMRIRMVQFATVSDRLYRVVRQAGKDADKRVVMELKGGNAEIDRSVLERMAGPMEHLLRNSVAHGIESRAERIAAGKPETGELVVEMRQEGNEVIMSFSDDGAGLNYAKIEQRARERGLLPEGRKATERELAQLIFSPGFSTAAEVTTLSGRGIGMDVVRAEVSAMGGRIDIDATPGAGTRFTIHLPVSLAVSQVVLLGVDEAKFAVQAALVEQILQVRPEVLAAAYEAHAIECDGEAVPMYFLGSLLELPQSRPVAQRQSPVVIVRAGSSRIALHVDRVVPNQEVVIKNVGPQLARLTGIAGATVLGNGDIVLILNPVQLALATRANQAGEGDTAHFAATEIAATATIMVVDDSVTVRKVTQRLLVREGYTVLLAKDGVDALRQLQDVVPDMMLVDIEMPRMDGFDLTKNIRSTDRLQHIPIIMITSRTADKHRNHALSLGVDVFLGKPYGEEELLRHVRGFATRRGLEQAW